MRKTTRSLRQCARDKEGWVVRKDIKLSGCSFKEVQALSWGKLNPRSKWKQEYLCRWNSALEALAGQRKQSIVHEYTNIIFYRESDENKFCDYNICIPVFSAECGYGDNVVVYRFSTSSSYCSFTSCKWRSKEMKGKLGDNVTWTVPEHKHLLKDPGKWRELSVVVGLWQISAENISSFREKNTFQLLTSKKPTISTLEHVLIKPDPISDLLL